MLDIKNFVLFWIKKIKYIVVFFRVFVLKFYFLGIVIDYRDST